MNLSDYRRNVDEINLKILDLLNERARCAVEIGRLKQLAGLPMLDPKRERQILDEIQAKNEGPLRGDSIRRIFETIIEECRKLEFG